VTVLRRLRLLLVAIAILGLNATAVAVAGNLSSWRANNDYGAVGFNQCALTTKMHDVFHDNDAHDIAPTDIDSPLYHDGCKDGLDVDEYDVRVNDYNYGDNGKLGWAECHYLNTSEVCEAAHAHINLYYDNYTYGEARSLMCEEIGHTVGLGHRASTDWTCMSQQWNQEHLDGHDIQHLNDLYDDY
jgi:hypothetical protein